jgi:hypothetical protein
MNQSSQFAARVLHEGSSSSSMPTTSCLHRPVYPSLQVHQLLKRKPEIKEICTVLRHNSSLLWLISCFNASTGRVSWLLILATYSKVKRNVRAASKNASVFSYLDVGCIRTNLHSSAPFEHPILLSTPAMIGTEMSSVYSSYE